MSAVELQNGAPQMRIVLPNRMPATTCSGCEHFRALNGNTFCARNAPTVLTVPGADGSLQIMGLHPPRPANAPTCGEYRPQGKSVLAP
jgi:hypothetical protein